MFLSVNKDQLKTIEEEGLDIEFVDQDLEECKVIAFKNKDDYLEALEILK